MAVKLARLQSIPEEVEDPQPATVPNRRKEARFAAWFDATLENGQGDRANIQIAEVSLHGCRIHCELHWIRTGSFVSIGIENDAKLQAIVRWVRDGAAGMEFLRPIPPECQEWHALMDASL